SDARVRAAAVVPPQRPGVAVIPNRRKHHHPSCRRRRSDLRAPRRGRPGTDRKPLAPKPREQRLARVEAAPRSADHLGVTLANTGWAGPLCAPVDRRVLADAPTMALRSSAGGMQMDTKDGYRASLKAGGK